MSRERLLRQDKVTVLITAIGGGGYGGQILKALRLAAPDRYSIVGTDAAEYCIQFSQVDHAHRLPRADAPDYFDALFALCDKYGVRAVFPGCEPELIKMSDARTLFAARGILLPIGSKTLIDDCLDKERTNNRLQALGYPPPRYLKVTERSKLNEIDWFPVVVKPSVGGGGSANCDIAQNEVELMALCDYLGLENIAGSFIVQEYVGTPESEFTVGILHDLDGNYVNSIGIRRLLSGQLNIRSSVVNRTGRKDLGPRLVISSGVSQGHVGRFPEVTDQCREIARALQVQGAINIQCRLVDGVVKVFEINPRFSGTTSVRAMMGYNEPDVLLQQYLHAIIPERDFAYESGVVLRGLTEHRVA
jgi:carbamoyl-phosphate synthase large subunit